MKYMKSLFTVFFILFLASCGSVQKVQVEESEYVTEVKHVIYSDYLIGEKKESFIGDPLITVKDYYIEEKSQKIGVLWQSEQDFQILNDLGNPTISKYKGDIFTQEGIIKYQGNKYIKLGGYKDNSINVNGSSFKIMVLINKDGISKNNLAWASSGGNSIFVQPDKIKPTNIKFKMINKGEIKKKVVAEKGYINYELVYGGTTDKEVKISYREYTPKGMARQAFFQNLTYSKNEEIIRFKKIKIKIHSVDNQKIVYTVLSDT